MAETPDKKEKKARLTPEEYLKIKEKRAKEKLKLHIPLWMMITFIVPFVLCLFLFIYYIMKLRLLPEH